MGAKTRPQLNQEFLPGVNGANTVGTKQIDLTFLIGPSETLDGDQAIRGMVANLE